jgi:uracil phosphoribosyltransferase
MQQPCANFIAADDRQIPRNLQFLATTAASFGIVARVSISETSGVTVVDHPLVRAKLTRLRDKTTPPGEFRKLVREISGLMAFEATRTLDTVPLHTETPMAGYEGKALARPVIIVPILRAGLGMADGMHGLLSESSTGHVGIYRDEATALPQSYYLHLPPDVASAEVLLVDPMLATGGSASAAIEKIKQAGAIHIRFVCIVSCVPGIERLRKDHPEVPIFTAETDPELNDRCYIVPGLGDAGDRYFGT